MNTMRIYSDRVGGTHNTLNQGRFIRNYGLQHRRGVCYALSMTYLAMDLFDLDFGAGRGEEATWRWVDKLQGIANSADDAIGSFGMVPKRVDDALKVVALQPAGIGRPSQAPFSAVAGYIGRSTGHYLVLFPNHACAAIHQRSHAVKFFDPNYGQARFTTTHKANWFLWGFLNDRKIMEIYDTAESGVVAVVRLRRAGK